MKKKQYFYKISCGRRIDLMDINTWLRGCKDYSYSWDMLNKESVYGIRTLPKRRHIRSIVVRNLKKLRGRINYYAHQYRKPHRVTIIFRPTWE